MSQGRHISCLKRTQHPLCHVISMVRVLLQSFISYKAKWGCSFMLAGKLECLGNSRRKSCLWVRSSMKAQPKVDITPLFIRTERVEVLGEPGLQYVMYHIQFKQTKMRLTKQHDKMSLYCTAQVSTFTDHLLTNLSI